MTKNTKEYEMLRQEILQYLEEYQSVRNMMYLITATLLGFCLNKDNTIVYAYLLPLIVIFPSYIISYDYWKCVTKASTYLQVFHEKKENYPCHWETRHRNFSKICNFTSKSDYPSLPYMLCSFICELLYFFYIDYSKCCYIEIIIGIITIAIGIFIFIKYHGVNTQKYIETWEKVQKMENKRDTIKNIVQ